GGARIRAVRADVRRGDAVLPARPARADPESHGGLRAERGAGAADPLLLGVPAGRDGAVAAARAREPARRAGRDRRARARRAGAGAADRRPGRPRHAVDRPLGPFESPAGDPAVLPDRLLRGAARTPRRAAGGAAAARGFGAGRVAA